MEKITYLEFPMIKLHSLQFKISMIILIPFSIMLIISSIVNILSVSNVTKKLSYKILNESAKGEASKLENIVQESLDSLNVFEFTVDNLYQSGERNRDVYRNTTLNFFSTLSEGTGALFLVFEPNVVGNDIRASPIVGRRQYDVHLLGLFREVLFYILQGYGNFGPFVYGAGNFIVARGYEFAALRGGHFAHDGAVYVFEFYRSTFGIAGRRAA